MNSHYRNLILIQGDEQTIAYHLDFLTNRILGDWVTISSLNTFTHQTEYHIMPNQAKSLLGSEFKHAIFDARKEFNLDAFAILSGTLIANSILIIMLPNDFSHWVDFDSLRWNEQPNPIEVPNFITHLKSTIQDQKDNYPCNIYQLFIEQSQQHNDLFDFIKENILIKKDNSLPYDKHTEQSNLLKQLLLSEDDIIVLTAKRGRGKSALAGMFSRYHHCWVTAPNKRSISTLAKFAEQQISFFAPDELINRLQISKERPDWLIIDEAAMIPLPMVITLLNQSYKVLLTSTVDGYEGTGQGLLLKLCQQHQSIKKIGYYQLSTPIRWVDNDPVEYFTDNLMVAKQHKSELDLRDNNIEISKISQQTLVESPNQLNTFFGLLKSAHYRTTLTDLRRILDAQNIGLYQAKQNEQITGVLVTIKEGGLNDELIDLVWKGVRRPKGNLVAQSLVAHAGVKLAAKLHSVRINRIAVKEDVRKQGIARKLIQQLIMDNKSEHCDFISVSFAYTPEIYQFWTKLGFTIIHIGTHKEASSGCYAAMAILPISEEGHSLKQTMQNKLARDWFWLQNWIKIDLPVGVDKQTDINQEVNFQDRLELLHFATTYYPYSASLAALSRLANWIKNYPNDIKVNQHSLLLLDIFVNKLPEDAVVKKHGLTGKNQLVIQLREDVKQLVTILYT